MVKSITKYARTILDVRRIPEYIGRTIAEAISDCPGPVYIEIPKNVMESSVNAEEIKMQRSYVSGSRPCGNSEDIKKALELINSAERPIIVAGGGVWWAKAAHLLIAAQAAYLVLFPIVIIDGGYAALFGNFVLPALERDSICLLTVPTLGPLE